MDGCVEERMKKLRELREKLCLKNPAWKDGFKVRDWVVEEIECIKSMAKSPDISKEQIYEKASTILDALNPQGE